MILQLTRRDFTLLGKLVAKLQPKVAEQLLSDHSADSPLDKDLNNINFYFLNFCKVSGIEADDFAFSRYDRPMIANKRVFIGVLLRIYSPGSLRSGLPVKWGILKRTAELFKHNPETGHAHKLISDTIFQYKAYDDFREQVDNCVEKIMEVG